MDPVIRKRGRPSTGNILFKKWLTPAQHAACLEVVQGRLVGTAPNGIKVYDGSTDVGAADIERIFKEKNELVKQLRLQAQRADQLQADVDAKVAYVEKHGWDNAAVAYWKRKYEELAGAARNSEYDQTA